MAHTYMRVAGLATTEVLGRLSSPLSPAAAAAVRKALAGKAERRQRLGAHAAPNLGRRGLPDPLPLRAAGSEHGFDSQSSVALCGAT